MQVKLFSLFFLIIFSCSTFNLRNKNQYNPSFLTGDSTKYWSDIWKKPYFESYKEGGLSFTKSGVLIEYQLNSDNNRVIVSGPEDVICQPTTFKLKSDTLYIKKCGYEFVFKIVKLTSDTLKLKEVPPYGFFPDLGLPLGSIPIIYIKSEDQYAKPFEDYQDYHKGPIKVYPSEY